MKKDTPEQIIVKREIITDQSDPRMIEFRKSNGEFAPGKTRGRFICCSQHSPIACPSASMRKL